MIGDFGEYIDEAPYILDNMIKYLIENNELI